MDSYLCVTTLNPQIDTEMSMCKEMMEGGKRGRSVGRTEVLRGGGGGGRRGWRCEETEKQDAGRQQGWREVRAERWRNTWHKNKNEGQRVR